MALVILVSFDGGEHTWNLDPGVTTKAAAEAIIKTVMKDGVWHDVLTNDGTTHPMWHPPQKVIAFQII